MDENSVYMLCMDNLEKQLQETKDIREKRAEIMRRLRDGENGRKYTLRDIANIYGCTKSYVKNEIDWLEGKR